MKIKKENVKIRKKIPSGVAFTKTHQNKKDKLKHKDTQADEYDQSN